jgi:hypothetical protein
MDHSTAPETALVVAVIAFYGFVILVGVAACVLWIAALIDCLRREFPDSTEKLLWVLVIIFVHFLGALIYYFVGRSRGRLPTASPMRM